MAKSSKLRVMLSSRCNDSFPIGQTKRKLSDLRKDLKQEIEAIKIGERDLFEVWINEDTPPQSGNANAWEVCLDAARECDIFIALCNGDAGWARPKHASDLGVCHAELEQAFSSTTAKVYVVQLEGKPARKGAAGKRNKAFEDYVKRLGPFRGGKIASTEADAKELVLGALSEAIVKLTQSGVVEASKGRNHNGAALDWTRLDFKARRDAMVAVLHKALFDRPGSKEEGSNVVVEFGGHKVLMVPHAIPAAFGVGPARELVGQPFLNDHRLAPSLSRGRGGPVHVIACHKNATENQAAALLGFPDATIISAPFGVFVADRINKVQFVFLTHCQDPSSTKHAVQRFMDWLDETGEALLMANRAKARASIVRIIAKEMI
ncbi:MAG: DUF4062 domain-containing protein [Flavobacteriales bacterium]|nr:DUF4062 domain-containing protein [Flavobacteriales bacterium]